MDQQNGQPRRTLFSGGDVGIGNQGGGENYNFLLPTQGWVWWEINIVSLNLKMA